MGLKLSIIVPVYNVEKYLRKCVDSLLAQDLLPGEYEIILVDDGSPDRCAEICDNYAAAHPNIKVIHRENGGLSAARNSGIDIAQGKYLQFVDSDDFIQPNVLKSLLQKIEDEQLDILRFNYQNVNEKYEVFEPNKVSKPFVDYRDEVCDGLTFLNERLGYACYACQFIIRRELLVNCHFKEGIYFEDTEWTPRIMLKANRVTSTDFMIYNYLVRSGSITKSIDEKKKRKVLDDKICLIDYMKEQMSAVEDHRWFDGMVSQTVISIVSNICDSFYAERSTYFLILKQKNIFPLSSFHATISAKRKIWLANVSLSLLCFLLHIK